MLLGVVGRHLGSGDEAERSGKVGDRGDSPVGAVKADEPDPEYHGTR
jgi:hypothetical protein